jgi:hypothetical protein
MSAEPEKPTRLAGMAAVLCAAPLVGIPFTAWGVIQAFEKFTADNRIIDPAGLRHAVGESLYATAVGLLLALVGFPIALRCIFGKNYRPWWLLMAAAFAGFMLAWVVVHGTWIYLHPPDNAAN